MKDNQSYKLSEFEDVKMESDNNFEQINELSCENDRIEESEQENSLSSSLDFKQRQQALLRVHQSNHFKLDGNNNKLKSIKMKNNSLKISLKERLDKNDAC